MADEREQIAESILAVLRESAEPLKAREIADMLHGRGLAVTRTTVNSVLYHELSKAARVAQDSQYRWSATLPNRKAMVSAHDPQELDASYVTSIGETSGPSTEECRAARRVLQVLRLGTTSCRAAKAVSVGTKRIEQELYSRTDSLLQDGTKGDMIVIAADWGFGKSHTRMLISSHLSEQGIPFIHECIDARAASLAHIHRSVPRWLERIQFGRTVGLRDALSYGVLPQDKALTWAASNYSDFAYGLRWAMSGSEWGWLRALGHLYRSPDYPYQHPKAWSLVESVATFLNKMNRGGLVLLLDEAENIDKQYDIRGRRKSYDTLGRMGRHPHILPVLFVTDRLLYQLEQDAIQGTADSWGNWTPDAKWFVGRFQEIQPLRPPRLTDGLAEQLVSSVARLYRTAYPNCSSLEPELVLTHWRQTPTRSTRLLVRLTVNELDLRAQNGSVK
ncbi:MAG: hypothetical protein KF777_17290 [Planctomycetaceae bacterium]|nr:hypothetical protein [Planctomycetaceae bacterium]